MWKYIFSVATFATLTLVCAQNPEGETGTVRASWTPHEIKIGLNAIRSGRTLAGSNITTHEGEVALAIQKFVLVGNYGIEKHQWGATYNYENNGSYFRVGVDRNFVKNTESGNALTLGLRYARANFGDKLVYNTNLGFGEQTYVLSNKDLRSGWMEVVFGIRGRVVANLYMGFSMRWQTFRSLKGEGTLKTYEIPGFGKTKRKNSTAFDYYPMWRIPFK